MNEILQLACSVIISGCYLILFPWLVITIIDKYPGLFKGARRQMLFLVVWGIISWLFTNALWYLPMILKLRQISGPEAAMAITGGWAYMGLTSIPFFLIYGIIAWFRGNK